jgi:hypothetical protein
MEHPAHSLALVWQWLRLQAFGNCRQRQVTVSFDRF